MGSQEEKIRQMLDHLGRELIEALHGSRSMSYALARIRQEGYALHLALGCQQQSEEEAPRKPVPPATFRLSTEDVSFLKSIGIDPTRNARRRRKPA